MSKFILTLLSAVAIAFTFGAPAAQAQPPAAPELKEDIDDLNRLDPDIEKYFPRWKILEADLKVKLAQTFRMMGAPVSESDEMIVTASLKKKGSTDQDIVTIKVGNDPKGLLTGTQRIKGELGESPTGLYQQILNRDYAYQIIPPAVPITTQAKERIPNVLQPTNAKQFIALSAFRQAVQLGKTGALLEQLVGNDEIGYHFWSSGQGKALLGYPIIELDNDSLRAKGVPDVLTVALGAAYRLKIGSDSALNQIIAPRKLNGALGAKAVARIEYRFPQINDVTDLGIGVHAEIPFTKLANVESTDFEGIASQVELKPKVGRPDTIAGAYFLRTVAQGVFFWGTWLNDYEHFFRVSLGASYQEIEHTMEVDVDGKPINPNDPKHPKSIAVQMLSLIHPSELEDWIYAKVEYLNQSGFPFGASVQIANRNLLIDGFIPLVPNWLFIEAKYSTPILRDNPAPWENKSFFMVSPILRFKID